MTNSPHSRSIPVSVTARALRLTLTTIAATTAIIVTGSTVATAAAPAAKAGARCSKVGATATQKKVALVCNKKGTTLRWEKAPVATGTLISYNSPAQWANYGEVLAGFERKTGVKAPSDPKNSGQTLAALLAERGAPVADTAYWGIVFGTRAKTEGLLEAYTPNGAAGLGSELKDPDGMWHTVHSGSVAFLVNTKELKGAPVPQSWADLLKPEYKGKVGYLDPSQAAVGYSVATSVNLALGGTLDNFTPGIDYLKKLKANGAVTPAQTATAQLIQGEIPILIDADFNGYKAKNVDGASVEVVIPKEGTLRIPYTVALVKNSPNPVAGKAFLDYLFSEEGQQLFAKGFVRPVLGNLPPDIAAKVLPATEYTRSRSVDFAKMAAVQQTFVDRYKAEVLAG